MDITHMSESELKALAFDQIKERDRVQQNINVIEAELERRAQARAQVESEAVQVAARAAEEEAAKPRPADEPGNDELPEEPKIPRKGK